MTNAGEVRLLVIDDDSAICSLIKSVLHSEEYSVDTVDDGEFIEEQIKAHKYDIIILDYVIPDVPIERTFEWIQEHQPNASIIVVTAFPTMDAAVQCLRHRTYDYITKPFSVKSLQRTVNTCLESKGLLRMSEDALREALGSVIRERRKWLNLTLADMAKRSSVSLGYLSQIELGKNSASVETLYRISLGLRLRLADLFEKLQNATR